MGNFIVEFLKGQQGGNKGLPLGAGLYALNKAINGIQKGRIVTIASAPKVGKSTLTDYAFLLSPYLYAEENKINVEWIYYSFELDRISKEFDFATFFLKNDYKYQTIELPDGVKKNGREVMNITPDYLRGRVQDDNGKIITINPTVKEALKVIYEKRLIPLFGEYDKQGQRISRGRIDFVTQRDNPTGIYKSLIEHAGNNGDLSYQFFGESKRIIGYNPKDPDKYTIVITDHCRKLMPERNYSMKQTVDKFVEYSVELRNLFGYTFIHIIHTNRSIGEVGRLKNAGSLLYPTSDDIKETGNLSEDSDHVITMLNPNDDKYGLKEHFGIRIKDDANNEYYPNLRTIHLVESRHVKYPQHFMTNMDGNSKSFELLDLLKRE